MQLAPLWIFSAVAGRETGFSEHELRSFWDTLVEVTLRTPRGAREILLSLTEDRASLLLAFELDDRSVGTGLRHAVEALAAVDDVTAADFKVALLRIGSGLAQARGPWGRTISAQDTQLLLLLAELLDLEATPSGVGQHRAAAWGRAR